MDENQIGELAELASTVYEKSQIDSSLVFNLEA